MRRRNWNLGFFKHFYMITLVDKSTSTLIKEYASEVGFDLCGFAPARALEEHRSTLTEWVIAGMNGDMEYLGQNIDKRIDPGILFPGAKSVIVTGLNYYSEKKQGGNGVPVISRYAYGDNYHEVIKKKLNKILDYINSIHPEAVGRSFVDSAPILEKAWAREAGLGWPGKHSILINSNIGSFFFLGVIITNIELEYDHPAEADRCGTRKCIAYLTLETKSPVPDEMIEKLEGRAFGCDRCQEVCPWNKNSKHHKTEQFDMSAEVEHMSAIDWKNLTRKDFKILFKRSAILRRSYCRFMDNIEAASASVS